jgi:hypothetical protein
MSEPDGAAQKPTRGQYFGFLVVTTFFCWAITYDCCSDAWRTEAVKKGTAEYVTTPEGYPRWQWKTPKNEPPR